MDQITKHKCELDEQINSEVYLMWEAEYQDQIDIVLSQNRCDIDQTFLGFMKNYYYLSIILPKYLSIVDFGCAYAAQCIVFKDHRNYIGIDTGGIKRFRTQNCKFIEGTFKQENQIEFEERFLSLGIPTDKCFLICNYVPGDHQWLTNIFDKYFFYYPSNKK